MLIKHMVLAFLFLLTGCIKPLSVRVEEQPASAKQPVEKLAYVADRTLWLTTLGGTDKQKIDYKQRYRSMKQALTSWMAM